jgi:hypothetical protein
MDIGTAIFGALAAIAAIFGCGSAFKVSYDLIRQGKVGRVLGGIISFLIMAGGSAALAAGTFMYTAYPAGSESRQSGYGIGLLGLLLLAAGYGLAKLIDR